MKENWTYKKLGEVVDILNGYAFKSSNYVDKGIRIIRIANVQKGLIEDKEPAYYPLTTEAELSRYMLHADDILMSLTGNVGRVGLLPKEMLPAALNQRVACIRLISQQLDLKLLYYYLNSDLFENKCIASSRGIAQLNMSTEWLKEQLIPVPPLATQQAIVRELDAINEVLSKKREQLKELDKLAQSIFYDMFGDPVTNEKGWEVKNITDMCNAITGITYKPTDIAEQGMIVLRSSNVQEGQIDLNDIVRVNTKISEKYYIRQGDILMCSRNGSFRLVGKAAIMPFVSEQMTWGAFMTVLRSECNPYLLEYLRTNAFRNQLSNAKTTTVNQITIGMLGKISIPLPPLPLQQQFAEKIEKIEQMKENLKASIRETETLLASRMSYYFE